MDRPLRFQPIAHSWVAVHPKPRGVIQFVGGAFFGTFGPMFFYRHLLQYFFDKSYTIVLLPFNFSFNHYRESISLLKEQYQILPELVRIAISEGYEYNMYLKDCSYYWIGHSIGCKYIALLEAFTALPEEEEAIEKFISDLLTKVPEESYSDSVINRVTTEISTLIKELKQEAATAKTLIYSYTNNSSLEQDLGSESIFFNLFINNQPSILLAPCTSDTSSAIQPKALADLFDKWGLGVKPTPAVTRAIIQNSNLFNLLGLVSFKVDAIAFSTCEWFIRVLSKPPQENQKSLLGGHLRPLGVRIGQFVFNPFFDKPLLAGNSQRNAALESQLDELLETLSK